jgi:hypothetical protein
MTNSVQRDLSLTFGRPYLSFSEKGPFLSARVLARMLATSRHAIKEILTRHLGMRKFTRAWVLHELSVANKGKRVADAGTLLQALENGQSQNLSHMMTGDESWFDCNYDSLTMFARAR